MGDERITCSMLGRKGMTLGLGGEGAGRPLTNRSKMALLRPATWLKPAISLFFPSGSPTVKHAMGAEYTLS